MNSLQQCAEEFIALYLSESPTGQIRLMDSILERSNMRHAVSVYHALPVMLMMVSLLSETNDKGAERCNHLGLCSPESDFA
jgi:hypothetical protein